MTREENIAKLTKLKEEAEAAVKTYNEAMQAGKFEDANKADELITEKVNEYTSVVQTMCFDDCKNSENPMITAVKALSFMTIATHDEEVEESKLKVRSIVDREKKIDLLKLHKYCVGIGADKEWPHLAQKMNFHLTIRQCKRLGVDPKKVNDSYTMSEIAKSKDFGKDPTSNTTLIKTLQTVITAMLGEGYKCTSHDVNYLTDIYAKKNSKKALSVICAGHRYFVAYLAEICHRIVTEKGYDAEFKTKD